MKKLVSIFATCVLLSACAQQPQSSDSAGTPLATVTTISHAWPVSTFPEVTLQEWNSDTTIQTRSLKRAVVVNLWASWCTACSHEMPLIAESPFASDVIAINVNDVTESSSSKAAAQKLVDMTHGSMSIYVDKNNALLSALKVTGLPVTFAVDSSGHIVDYELGELSNESLSRLVKASKSS